jgi:hypothetical protein
VNSRVISRSGSITRCSEREVALLCLVRTFLNSSFDTKLLLKNSSGQLFSIPYRLLAEMNKETPTHRSFLRKIYLIHPHPQLFFCNNASVTTSSSKYITSTDIVRGRAAANGIAPDGSCPRWQRYRGWRC